MVGRALTFSDPRVISLLQQHFIPVAVNQDYLVPLEWSHRNWSESAKFMTDICKKAGRGTVKYQTVQGYYVISAAGDLYGVMGACADPGQAPWMIKLLEDGLKGFSDKPPPKVELKEVSLGPETKAPEGTVVLRVFTRIDPLPKGLDPKKDLVNRGVGRDHLWILKDEQSEILKRLAASRVGDLPDALGKRIVLHHLRDNVRGEPLPWGMDDVKALSFRISLTKDSKTTLLVNLTGSYSLNKQNPESGLTGTLEGLLELDKSTRRLKAAKIYASGEAFGAGPYTWNPPDGKFPLKFAMVLAEDDLARNIAPHSINFGSEEGNGRLERYLDVGRR